MVNGSSFPVTRAPARLRRRNLEIDATNSLAAIARGNGNGGGSSIPSPSLVTINNRYAGANERFGAMLNSVKYPHSVLRICHSIWVTCPGQGAA